jgi:hypothetical protein
MAKELFTHPKVQCDMYVLVGSAIHPGLINELKRMAGLKRVNRVAFWGCGMRDTTELPQDEKKRCLFFGVRGPYTRDTLGLPKSTPLGDPGLLAPLFHRPKLNEITNGKIIGIPHMFERKKPGELVKVSGVDMIVRPECASTELGLREILDKIASARFVLAGSLHSAIIACSYNKPFAFWDTGFIDIPFKWKDFAESINIPCKFHQNIVDAEKYYHNVLHNLIKIPSRVSLLDCCPFMVKPSKLIECLVLENRLDNSIGIRAIKELQNLSLESHEVIYDLQDLEYSKSKNLCELLHEFVIHLLKNIKKIFIKVLSKTKCFFQKIPS